MDLATGSMGSLLPKFVELLNHEYKLQKGIKEGIKSLEKEMKSMQAALRKVTMVPQDQLDEQVKLWAGEVRDLSFEMENFIDKVILHVNQESNPVSKSNKLKRLTEKMAILLTKGKARQEIADALQDINKQVQEVAIRLEHHRYIVDDIVSMPTVVTPDLSRPALCMDVTEPVGIMGERDQELIKFLLEGDNDTMSKLKIVSVVGFGGFGKTTLVNIVYGQIKGYFDFTAFVPVGKNADVKKIFMDILLDLGMHQTDELTMLDGRQLIDKLRESLKYMRYLIVIDDLWDQGIWSTISCIFPRSDRGSRVIITTRVNKVAENCCSDNKDLIYKIRPLGYQDSKRLFLRRCFGSEDSCRDAQTEVDEILKICGGMPLAIISIASGISPFSGRNINEAFQEVIKSLYSARGDLDCVAGLARILSYSYLDFPNTLQSCLLYLAASAKNLSVERDNLVRKWISEGLIPIYEDCSREEVAREFFNELVDSNVIQPVKYANCLGKETYEVTYMMLYVLRLLAREGKFATFLSKREPDTWSVTMPDSWVSFKHMKSVRVLDMDGCKDLDNSAMDDICLMVMLKYLSLKRTQVTKIPPEISNLRSLETLDVRNCQITTLPPQIGELQNLETLDVRHTLVSVLPKEVFWLRKLTHLHFGQSGSLGVKLPLGSISNYQLSSLEVMGSIDSKECSETAMKEISELARVRELEVVLYDGPTPGDMGKSDKLLSSVGKCSNLKSLTIHGDSSRSDDLPLQSPNFPQLQKLVVAGRFQKVPRWIEQLRTLTLLVLRVCKLEENDMVTIGGLPRLTVLSLALVALPRKQVTTITSSTGFASLEVFCFDCRVPWVSFEERAMPNLKHLELKLYSAPAGKSPSGITLLVSLSMVVLLYSSQYAASVGVIEAVDVVKSDAKSHDNLIELSINGAREFFPSNRSARRGVAGKSADGGVAGKSADGGVTGTEANTSVKRMTTRAEIVEVL